MYFSQVNNAIEGTLNGETVRIMPWGKNSLRVVTRMMGEPVYNNWALLDPEPQTTVIEIGEHEASITVGGIKAVARKKKWATQIDLSFYNKRGELLLAEKFFQGALNRKARHYKPIIGGDYRLTVNFEGDSTQKLYGMGQYQQEILDVNGCSFELAHRNSQASIPFVLSSKGYGFLWHNPAVGKASFNKNGFEWVAESTKQVDYWITAGDTPAEIISSYSNAVGKAPAMPEYGLGYWHCKLRYWNQELLLETAREYKRRGIPVNVIVCDFFHWPHMGDYRFDDEFFPDPDSILKELKDMGMELMVSVWPQVGFDSENYQEMTEKGLLIGVETGLPVSMRFFNTDTVFFDATNPKTRVYIWEKCKKNYYDKGIKMFWLDEAEPEFGTYDYENYRYYSGSVLQTGNLYPQFYSRLFYEGMKNEGQDKIVNLVRCAWAGSARYGALVWSGDIRSDFDTFRQQICAGLSMGIAGIPWWTTDIGGFYDGDPDDPSFRELLIRWFQWGAFCPVMRMHGDRLPQTKLFRKDGREVMSVGGNNELWDFGDEAYPILTKYISLRERMRDYIRGLMEDASVIGKPVMRTMFYEFPEDSVCWQLMDQYMFGPDLLVAPVTAPGKTSREVYLPNGTWTEQGTGNAIEGGRTITAAAPLSYIPVFIREGSHPELVGES